MTGQDRIEQPRLEKLSRLISRGIDPYPHKFQRTHSNIEAIALYPELNSVNTAADMPVMRLAGRITAIRFMGKAAFFDIRDGSGKLQVFFRRDSLGEESTQSCTISTWAISWARKAGFSRRAAAR